MNVHSRTTVTSAEFTRNFGHLRQTLDGSPVFITHHGRETHVLVTAARYHDLETAARSDPGTSNATMPALPEFIGWIQQGAITLDDSLRIVLANGVAHAMLKRSDGDLVGKFVFDAIPELMGSLFQLYVSRAIKSRERCSADLPSLLRKDGWTRLEIFPSASSTTVLFHDITEDIRTNRLADAKKATVEAMAVHGGVGSIRLNMRGHIEKADAAMCTILGLPEPRLVGVTVADLVPVARRVAFRECLDGVLRGDGSCRIETDMLTNDGTVITVRGAITELRGAYGPEGAILVVTRP